MQKTLELFDTRLATLQHLLAKATAHFDGEEFMAFKLADDMFPFNKQLGICCNLPNQCVQWLQGETVTSLDLDLPDLAAAQALIAETREKLAAAKSSLGEVPAEKYLELGPENYAELPASEYVDDFLLPNFYFHLATAYNILRANGVEIGKVDFLTHLMDRVKSK